MNTTSRTKQPTTTRRGPFSVPIAFALLAFCLASASLVVAQSTSQDGLLITPLSTQEVLTLQATRAAESQPGQSPRAFTALESPLHLAQGLDRWAVPRWVVDTRNSFDESTFWAIRNEDNVQVTVNITYRDIGGLVLLTETELLDVRQTVTRNLKSLTALRQSAQERVEGSITFAARRVTDLDAEDGRISIDTFTIDSVGDFANGGLAHSLESPCRFWSARFLNFGKGPSKIDILTESLGGTIGDPSTVMLTFYEEDGTLIGGLTILSPVDVFTIDIAGFTNKSFGVVELDFGSGRSGLVSVRHSAFGRFSVGHEAYCAQ